MAKRKPKMSTVEWLAVILLLVGGLNWGLVGLADFNLVEYLAAMAGLMAGMVATAAYALIGASAVYGGIRLFA